MGSLTDTYNNELILTRSTTTTSTGSDTTTTLATANCLIRPITDTTRLYVQSNFGKEFRLWTDLDTIRIGDYLTIDSVNYSVIGKASYEDLDGNLETHSEYRIVKK